MTDHIDKRPGISTAIAEDDRYVVHWRAEIIAIFNDLCRTGNLVTAYIGGDNDFILTSIVAVDAEKNTILLDYGANAAANKLAMTVDKILCVTSIDGIRIQMRTGAFHAATFSGRGVFAMTLPETLIRLQRREYYRIDTPRGNPIMCIFAPSEALPTGLPTKSVIDDISCGGIALVLPGATTGIEIGMRFNRCRIPLPEALVEATHMGSLYASSSRRVSAPDAVEVIVDMVVRGMIDLTFPNGVKHRHIGCEFIGMREHDRSLIQRYISKLELERRHRVGAR